MADGSGSPSLVRTTDPLVNNGVQIGLTHGNQSEGRISVRFFDADPAFAFGAGISRTTVSTQDHGTGMG